VINFPNLVYQDSYYVYITDLESREKTDPESVHIINIDIQDNQEEATIGAFMICDLCTLVRAAEIFSRKTCKCYFQLFTICYSFNI